MLSLHRATPVESGWKPQFRFKRQAEFTPCEFHLPKTGQSVKQVGTATGTIVCTTPWQLYDNGVEGGHEVADETQRPQEVLPRD